MPEELAADDRDIREFNREVLRRAGTKLSYLRQGAEFSEGSAQRADALVLYATLAGEENPSRAFALNEAANIYLERGSLTKARVLGEQSFAMTRSFAPEVRSSATRGATLVVAAAVARQGITWESDDYLRIAASNGSATARRQIARMEVATAPQARTADNRLGPLEQSISTSSIRDIQRALCVPPDGSLGQPTRTAIRDYLAGQGLLAPPDKITPAVRDRLSDAVDQVQDCRANGYENAFEAASFGAGAQKNARITAFQETLLGALTAQGATASFPASGVLDTKTRDAIAEYRRITKTAIGGGTSARDRQVDRILFRQLAP